MERLLNIYLVRLYFEDGQNCGQITIHDLRAETIIEARAKGIELAETLGLKLENPPYVALVKGAA